MTEPDRRAWIDTKKAQIKLRMTNKSEEFCNKCKHSILINSVKVWKCNLHYITVNYNLTCINHDTKN